MSGVKIILLYQDIFSKRMTFTMGSFVHLLPHTRSCKIENSAILSMGVIRALRRYSARFSASIDEKTSMAMSLFFLAVIFSPGSNYNKFLTFLKALLAFHCNSHFGISGVDNTSKGQTKVRRIIDKRRITGPSPLAFIS
jgi:hypothetical protein